MAKQKLSQEDRDLISKINSFRGVSVVWPKFECAECNSIYSPDTKELTGEYCADCYLEINYGFIPRQSRGRRR